MTEQQQHSKHTAAGTQGLALREQAGRVTGGGRGGADGRAEGLSAIGDRRQATVPLTPVIDGTHVCISEKLEVSYVGNLLCLDYVSSL